MSWTVDATASALRRENEEQKVVIGELVRRTTVLESQVANLQAIVGKLVSYNPYNP